MELFRTLLRGIGMASRLLLAGGMGFVGKNIIELLHSKYDIYVLDLKVDPSFISKYKIRFYEVDMRNQELVRNLIKRFSYFFF